MTLERALTRASLSDRDTVVSAIAFDYWSNLFRVEYADIWRTKANVAFPGLERGQGRRKIQQLSMAINILRNRIAHHEPILDANVPDLHSKMIRLTRLRCPITSEWMRHYSTVGTVMRSRPTSKGIVELEGRSDPNNRLVAAKGCIVDGLTELELQQGLSVRKRPVEGSYFSATEGVLSGCELGTVARQTIALESAFWDGVSY